MVPVLRVSNGFHARVVAARLGSEGIVTQLRGGIDTPYPMGAVDVLVAEEELALARDLLLADEVEDAFLEVDDDKDEAPPRRRRRRLAPWVAGAFAAVLVVAEVVAISRR